MNETLRADTTTHERHLMNVECRMGTVVVVMQYYHSIVKSLFPFIFIYICIVLHYYYVFNYFINYFTLYFILLFYFYFWKKMWTKQWGSCLNNNNNNNNVPEIDWTIWPGPHWLTRDSPTQPFWQPNAERRRPPAKLNMSIHKTLQNRGKASYFTTSGTNSSRVTCQQKQQIVSNTNLLGSCCSSGNSFSTGCSSNWWSEAFCWTHNDALGFSRLLCDRHISHNRNNKQHFRHWRRVSCDMTECKDWQHRIPRFFKEYKWIKKNTFQVITETHTHTSLYRWILWSWPLSRNTVSLPPSSHCTLTETDTCVLSQLTLAKDTMSDFYCISEL